MRWRATLALIAGLLLPLPVVVLLDHVLRPNLPEVGPGGKRISPVLSSEQRERLLTYHRDCGAGQPCEPPLGCLSELRIQREYCTDSECSVDSQCPEGQVCGIAATFSGVPLVRVCLPVGVRQEGEPCFVMGESKETSCAPGLICGGRGGSDDQWCGRPCQKADAATCPAGFFCAETVPEPVCFPTCEARGCPEGQLCLRHAEGASACAKVYGPHCQQTPCPRGGECLVWRIPERPTEAWLECVERCGERYPPCGEGLICDGFQCRTPCMAGEPAQCIKGYECRQWRPGRPYACQPTW
jgi:hypothetical protein